MIRGGGFLSYLFPRKVGPEPEVTPAPAPAPVAPAPVAPALAAEQVQFVPGFMAPAPAPVAVAPEPVQFVPGFMVQEPGQVKAPEPAPKAKEPGYLDKVDIIPNDPYLKAKILEKSFKSDFFSHAQTLIQTKIDDIKRSGQDLLSETWVSCNSCSEIAAKIITEINSTAYILRVLSKSFLKASTSKCTISFEVKKSREQITGVWDQDKDDIDMIFSEPNSSEPNSSEPNSRQRLIMGFGPSSSGKTYCAQKMIDVFCNTYPDFPKSFLTIDGGVYRENSKIYRMIVDTLKSNGVAGFTNLVLAGVSLTTSLFRSDSVKKKIMTYLTEKYTGLVSLYVPETLGTCGYVLFDKCSSKYQQYIDITGDKWWIALCIWQHKKGIDCDFTDQYKCLGCTESGQKREIYEGKQYSNAAWEHSMDQGERAIKEAPGGGYKIHSTGGKTYEVDKPCVIVIEVVKPDPTNLNLQDSGMVMMNRDTMIEISDPPPKRRYTLG